MQITSLLRTSSGSAFYKAIEAPEKEETDQYQEEQGQQEEASAVSVTYQLHTQLAAAGSNKATQRVAQHFDVEFIPTLNFVLRKPTAATTTAEATTAEAATSEAAQHVADAASTDCDNVDSSSDANDRSTTHTFIISRSSFTTGSNSSSSSTPYAVTSTDTAELLRQQNNLSLTEDDQTISSFSIEQPTSSMTIEMAEQQKHKTGTTTATTTRSEATSSGDGLGMVTGTATTTTTTTTTTSSSIEEDIEEAIELSEVEEQLPLSEAAAYARPESSSLQQSQQSAKVDSTLAEEEEEQEEANKFRIDDAQLSGGQLAQHFLVLEDDESDEDYVPVSPKDQTSTSVDVEEDEEEEDEDDDDFDISLPLERQQVVHSRHDDVVEGEEGEPSLSNQSTTDDVSDIGDEPQHVTSASATELEPPSQDQPAADSTALSSARVEESELDTGEQDHSMEEIMATNESIEITYDGEDAIVSSSQRTVSQKLEMVTDLDVVEQQEVRTVVTLKLPPVQQPQLIEPKLAKVLETLHLEPESLELTILELDPKAMEEDEDEENALQLMKLRLMTMQQQQQNQAENAARASPTEEGSAALSGQELKQMERVPLNEFSKDVLEDITEESERMLSLSTTAEEPQSLSLEESKTLLPGGKAGGGGSSSSVVSLNMLRQLEAKVQELNTQLETKDTCLASLNLQLEAARRDSSAGPASARESSAGPASARDSSSLVTNSTEYRTFQEEFGAPVSHQRSTELIYINLIINLPAPQTLDIYVELSRRDDMIAKLTDSLQQSLNVRGELQSDADRLSGEVQALRKQLQDTIETVKRNSGWSDQGQRISEISMDLISESEDELERNYLTDHEERGSRSSRERQLSVPRQTALLHEDLGVQPLPPEWPPAFSKQIEQFQKCLLPGELRPFVLVQRKFDDYLTQKLAECRDECAQDLKQSQERWESDKLLSEQQQQAAHAKQMEELRKYFEHRCADLEKQFSDDVFSHKSQRLGGDSSSECSEVDPLPEEISPLKEPSPRKRKRAELLLSPSHRQITPSGLDSLGNTQKEAKETVSLRSLIIALQRVY